MGVGVVATAAVVVATCVVDVCCVRVSKQFTYSLVWFGSLVVHVLFVVVVVMIVVLISRVFCIDGTKSNSGPISTTFLHSKVVQKCLAIYKYILYGVIFL